MSRLIEAHNSVSADGASGTAAFGWTSAIATEPSSASVAPFGPSERSPSMASAVGNPQTEQ